MQIGYKLGRTSEERQRKFEEIIYLYNEKNLSLEDIGKKYNVSRQAINQFLTKRGFVPYKEKDIKLKNFREKARNTFLEAKLEQMAKERKTQQVEKIIAQTKAKKYKKVLKEIKEIAYDGYNNGQTSYATFQCEKIINKINEAEDV